MDDGRVSQALDPYRKAVSLDPKAGLIRIALAHALIESAGHSPENPAMNDSPENAANNTGTGSGPLDEAITHLKEAARYETRSPRLHRLFATAYGRQGQTGVARLHLAEEAVLRRNWATALQHARSAENMLEEGQREHLQALDLINFIENHREG